MEHWKNRIIGTGTEHPEQLLANPFNPRKHPKHQQEALEGALNEIRWIQDVIVNQRSGHLIDGHLRVTLAMRKGEQEVPVKYVDLSQEEESLALATFDPISALAQYDQEALKTLIQDLQTNDAALLEMLGDLSGEDLSGLGGAGGGETDPDATPEPPNEPVSERGKLYQLGKHRVMCGDSTSKEDVALLMDGQKADMVFTDPPYGVDYDGGHAEKGIRREKLANDGTPDIYADVLPLCYGHSVEDAPMYLWYSDSHSAAVIAAVIAAKYELRTNIIWNKNMAQFGAIGAQYKTKHEPCMYCNKRGKSSRWGGVNNEVSVWDIARASKNEYHQTQKPTALAERAIVNHDVSSVLDMFLGSGSTLIACEKTNRQCFGMEISPKYIDVIRKRWAEFVHGEGCDWQELTPEA